MIMINSDEIEKYIHHNIPISEAMGIKIEKLDETAALVSAPLANNINHKLTVFGGSLHVVATLSCWSLLHSLLLQLPEKFEIVITHSDVDYLIPVTTDFQALCQKPSEEEWNRFLTTLRNKGRARLHLSSTIHQDDVLAVSFKGTFAAIKRN